MTHNAIDAYLIFTDKNHYNWLPRRAQFKHVVLLEQDYERHDRWLLRQWRNGREMVRMIQEGDFADLKGEELRMIDAIKRGMLDADMNGETDLDVRIIEARIPQVRPQRMFKWYRATDVGYAKWRLGLGVRHLFIRSPYQLYRLFEENGPDAVTKTAWNFSFWSILLGGIRLARKAG